MSLDRVSAAMEEPRERPTGRPPKGAPTNPKARNFRMAYCGIVTIHDENGEALHNIRYGTMPDGDIIGLRDWFVTDVATLISKRRDLKLQLLCDVKTPEICNLLEEGFTEDRFDSEIHRLVDLYHLTDKVGAAAQILEFDSDAFLKRWNTKLLSKKQCCKGHSRGVDRLWYG